jgi:hypothetical protein
VETQKLEHTGADGGPVAVQTARLDVSELTAEQRTVLRAAPMNVKAAAVVRG